MINPFKVYLLRIILKHLCSFSMAKQPPQKKYPLEDLTFFVYRGKVGFNRLRVPVLPFSVRDTHKSYLYEVVVSRWYKGLSSLINKVYWNSKRHRRPDKKKEMYHIIPSPIFLIRYWITSVTSHLPVQFTFYI